MNAIEKQLLNSQKRVAELKQKLRKQKAAEKAKLQKKPRKKSGRPRLDENIIIVAIKKAETKPLSDVALSLGISKRTLYNYGISRRALNAKADAETNKNKT